LHGFNAPHPNSGLPEFGNFNAQIDQADLRRDILLMGPPAFFGSPAHRANPRLSIRAGKYGFRAAFAALLAISTD
jgi:hypothetical protein